MAIGPSSFAEVISWRLGLVSSYLVEGVSLIKFLTFNKLKKGLKVILVQ